MTTKRDVVKAIAKEVNLSEQKTAEVVQGFLEQVIKTLTKEQRLELRNFGVFEVVSRKPKKVHHPITGDPISLPAYKTIHFKPSSKVKEKLN